MFAIFDVLRSSEAGRIERVSVSGSGEGVHRLWRLPEVQKTRRFEHLLHNDDRGSANGGQKTAVPASDGLIRNETVGC